MAGMGAVEAGAGPACRALAQRCDGLLATTLPARGLFHDDPFSLGVAGGFSLGRRARVFRRGGPGRRRRLLARPAQLRRRRALAEGAGAADRRRSRRHQPGPRRRRRAPARRRPPRRRGAGGRGRAPPRGMAQSPRSPTGSRTEPSDDARFEAEPGLHDPRDVVAALEAALPADWEMVNSSGHCSFYFAHMPSRPVRSGS